MRNLSDIIQEALVHQHANKYTSTNNLKIYKLKGNNLKEYWLRLESAGTKNFIDELKQLTLYNGICKENFFNKLVDKLDDYNPNTHIIIIRPNKNYDYPVYTNACTKDGWDEEFEYVEDLKDYKNFNINYWIDKKWI